MTTTKTKTKRTRTKKLDKQLDKVEDMNAPATKTKTKRTRTKKLDKVEAPVSEGSIGINPIENVDIYFKEKVFVVEKSKIKKGIVNDEFVDTAELPIGIVVYWSLDTQTWDMLGYKETLLR